MSGEDASVTGKRTDSDADASESPTVLLLHRAVALSVHGHLLSPLSPSGQREAKNISEGILRDIYHKDVQKKKDCINKNTVAVAICNNGRDVYVTSNYKSRPEEQCEKGSWSLGIDAKKHKSAILEEVQKALPDSLNNYNVYYAKPSQSPTAVDKLHKDHAEMQLKQILKTKGHLGDAVIGISKPACNKCAKSLKRDHVKFGNNPQPDRVQSYEPKDKWNESNAIDPKVEATQLKAKKRCRIETNFRGETIKQKLKSAFTPQYKKLTKQALKAGVSKARQSVKNAIGKPGTASKKVIKKTIKAAKPGGSAGSIVESFVEDVDRKGAANAQTLYAQSGSYKGRACTGVYAKAGLAEANASFSVFNASARAPNASAGAHAGCTGVSAFASAEVARAEASAAGIAVGVGLNVNTGVSAGVDGISASVAGFGFSIGPKMSIKTPLFDLSCAVQ